jgi:hypothetical protein
MKGARESQRAKKKNAREARDRSLATSAANGRFLKQIDERLDRARWLGRPQIHPAIFEDVTKCEECALAAKFGGSTQVSERRARKLNDLMNTLGLSGERRALFKQLVIGYRREPTIESYIQIRRKFPEVEIQIGQLGGLEALLVFLLEDFEKQGVDTCLVAAALNDGDEPSLDALSLHLLECLVARSKLPRDGVGYIEKRRSAISDANVNYLISEMLEGLDWHGEMVRVPASLIVLIRHQLCAGMPEMHQTFLSRRRRLAAAVRAAEWFKPGEKISVRKLASVTGIPRSTAARYLADEKFKEELQAIQRYDSRERLAQLDAGADVASGGDKRTQTAVFALRKKTNRRPSQ